jgi:hypothetical protein
MSDLISNGESETKEAPATTDFMGALKFGAMAAGAVLLVLGLTWMDFFTKTDDGSKPKKAATETKKDEDTVADYEKDYLDGDISEDALDEHTVGMTG